MAKLNIHAQSTPKPICQHFLQNLLFIFADCYHREKGERGSRRGGGEAEEPSGEERKGKGGGG